MYARGTCRCHQMPAAMVVASDREAEAIRAILKRIGHLIQHGLHHRFRAFMNHPPTRETARFALDRREDEGFGFLLPTNVNRSSCSMCAGGGAGEAGTSGNCSAAALTHASTMAWVTPTCRAAARKLALSNTRLMARRYFATNHSRQRQHQSPSTHPIP